MVQAMRAAHDRSPDFAAAGRAVNLNTTEVAGAHPHAVRRGRQPAVPRRLGRPRRGAHRLRQRRRRGRARASAGRSAPTTPRSSRASSPRRPSSACRRSSSPPRSPSTTTTCATRSTPTPPATSTSRRPWPSAATPTCSSCRRAWRPRSATRWPPSCRRAARRPAAAAWRTGTSRCAARSVGSCSARPCSPSPLAGCSRRAATTRGRRRRHPRRAPTTPEPAFTAVREVARAPGAGSACASPSLGVDAPVGPVGKAADGTVEVPTRWEDVGWYDGGARPGEDGPTVLLGHVDSKAGPAVFARLPQAPPGTVVEVVGDDGQVTRWRVDRIEQHPKTRFPTEAVYLPALRPRAAAGDVRRRVRPHHRPLRRQRRRLRQPASRPRRGQLLPRPGSRRRASVLLEPPALGRARR